MSGSLGAAAVPFPTFCTSKTLPPVSLQRRCCSEHTPRQTRGRVSFGGGLLAPALLLLLRCTIYATVLSGYVVLLLASAVVFFSLPVRVDSLCSTTLLFLVLFFFYMLRTFRGT